MATQDYSLDTYGVAVGVADRVEVSFATQDFRGSLAPLNDLRIKQDIVGLKDSRFDYAILDEAQAIKNAASQSAKAARLIKADHRLALRLLDVAVRERDLDVLVHREVVEQVIALEHEADVRRAECGQLVRRHRAQVLPRDDDFA